MKSPFTLVPMMWPISFSPMMDVVASGRYASLSLSNGLNSLMKSPLDNSGALDNLYFKVSREHLSEGGNPNFSSSNTCCTSVTLSGLMTMCNGRPVDIVIDLI
ncbi:hypothetical protein WICPIJ_002509 [Wickerhamomyces pijperi]|uniref:Uncharacterized protein n=1 Tax=Wickerhamomyces pijperi TaxID=599730 RepID=A0A9P8TQ38_WICPI|nr:hypothetical protein WICPIJ_002509 [Wickerhamomyces pijperi]